MSSPKGDYFKLENAFVDDGWINIMSASEHRLYLWLRRKTNNVVGSKCTIGLRLLAKTLAMHKETVLRSTERLEELKLVRVMRRAGLGRRNTYIVLPLERGLRQHARPRRTTTSDGRAGATRDGRIGATKDGRASATSGSRSGATDPSRAGATMIEEQPLKEPTIEQDNAPAGVKALDPDEARAFDLLCQQGVTPDAARQLSASIEPEVIGRIICDTSRCKDLRNPPGLIVTRCTVEIANRAIRRAVEVERLRAAELLERQYAEAEQRRKLQRQMEEREERARANDAKLAADAKEWIAKLAPRDLEYWKERYLSANPSWMRGLFRPDASPKDAVTLYGTFREASSSVALKRRSRDAGGDG